MSAYKTVVVCVYIIFLILCVLSVTRKKILDKIFFFTEDIFTRNSYIYFITFSMSILLSRKLFLKSHFNLQLLLLSIIIFCAYRLLTWKRLSKFILPEFNPYQLSWYRISICLVLLFMACINDIRQSVYISPELLDPPPPLAPILNWLGFEGYRSAITLTLLQFGTIISLILATLGVFTRFSMIIAAIFFTLHYYIQISYTHFFHSGFVPLQMLYALCIFGNTNLISIDTLLLKRKITVSTLKVQYAMFTCIAIYGLSYFATGLSKLYVDPFWANNHNLKRLLLSDSIGLIDTIAGLNIVPEYVKTDWPDIVFGLMGVFAIVLETSGFLMIFNRMARRWLPLFFVGMHFGIYLMHKFFFFDLLFLPIMFLSIGRPLFDFINKFMKAIISVVEPKQIKQYVLCCSLFVSLIFGGWLFGWEKYPVSSVWGMYAVGGYAELIWFKKIYAVTNSGERVDTDLTDEIPLLNTAKWQDVTPYPEHVYKDRMEILSKSTYLLRNYAELYNSKRKHEDQISFFDFRLIFWNFVRNPAGPKDEPEGFESVIIPVDKTKEPHYEQLHNHN